MRSPINRRGRFLGAYSDSEEVKLTAPMQVSLFVQSRG